MPIELLAPAGGLEQLRAALRYGADAVYLGLPRFGLRAYADNFDARLLPEAVALAHGMGKKVYVTLNAVLFDADMPVLLDAAKELAALGVDAAIVSDPGAVALLHSEVPDLPLHLSTQASTLNSHAAALWHSLGVSRIIVGRELSLAGIRAMRAATPDTLELEAFVHGAVCMAHSGRCLISAALTGRSANRGACAQPCRWDWTLTERSGMSAEQPDIREDARGSYVLSAGDLCMLPHLPALIESGLSSLKIEGRMKSAFYVATVVGAYRRALDAYHRDPGGYVQDAALQAELMAELGKVSHRAYDTGFFFGPPEHPGGAEGFTQGAEFIGVVLEVQTGSALVEVRNRFFVGDTLECLSPGRVTAFRVEGITDAETGESLSSINRPKARVWVPVPEGPRPEDLLRGRVRNHREGKN